MGLQLNPFLKYQELHSTCMIKHSISSTAVPPDLRFTSGAVPAVCQNIMLNRGTSGNPDVITHFPELHNLRNALLNLSFQQSFTPYNCHHSGLWLNMNVKPNLPNNKASRCPSELRLHFLKDKVLKRHKIWKKKKNTGKYGGKYGHSTFSSFPGSC